MARGNYKLKPRGRFSRSFYRRYGRRAAMVSLLPLLRRPPRPRRLRNRFLYRRPTVLPRNHCNPFSRGEKFK